MKKSKCSTTCFSRWRLNNAYLILHLFFSLTPDFILGQVDTLFSTPLSQHEIELKNNWDKHLTVGGNWRDILENKKYALDCKNIFIFEYLVRLGIVDINEDIDDYTNTFAQGCKCGNTYLVVKGLQNKIDINRQYKNGNTALMYSMQNGNASNSILLLAQGPDLTVVNSNGDNLLTIASKNIADTSLIKYLLLNGCDYKQRNGWGLNALEMAYYYGDETVFKFLLDDHLIRCDSTYWQSSKLLDAGIGCGDTMLIKRLLPLFDPNKILIKNASYLWAAASFVDFYYYSNKYRFNPIDSTRLYNTVDLDVSVFKILSEYGYNLNLTDSLGQNVLFKCRNVGPVVKFLLGKKISVNQVDIYGYTVLKYFIEDIINPPRYEFGITLKKSTRDYIPELELLRLYVEHGAVIGKEGLNGWGYIYQQAKEKNNLDLLKCLNEKYDAYIK
jgi:Ankyrin repeats (3 copies)